jgi:hypothetical protein
MMTTRFISIELDLKGSVAALEQAIASELGKFGNPLRWAITRVDVERQTVQIEAVVTVDARLDIVRSQVVVAI